MNWIIPLLLLYPAFEWVFRPPFPFPSAHQRSRKRGPKGAERLERHGAVVQQVSIDQISPELLQKSLAAYYILACAEASSNLARYDGFRYGVAADPATIDWTNDNTNEKNEMFSVLEKQYAAARTVGFGREVIRRVLCGTAVLSSDRFHTHYEAAAKLRARLTDQLHQTLAAARDDNDCCCCDLLLVPTSIFAPPRTDEPVDATEMLANDVMTVPVSLAGLPAVSIPVGKWSEASPFRPGLQLVAGRHGEPTLLRAAAVLEGRDTDDE